MPETRARWRFRLPHGEVADRPHFVTIRCAGSLPADAVIRIREIHESLERTEPSSPQFAALQRKYFLLCERYLDAGHGPCPFRDRGVCELAMTSLREFSTRKGWRVPHFTLMPNHVHLLLIPRATPQPLKRALRGWKWHIAMEANRLLDHAGSFWQTDWFDRWARTDGEALRMRDYIRQNPIKAGLATRWEDYPWTYSEPDAP
jgi:putative DNA methylase